MKSNLQPKLISSFKLVLLLPIFCGIKIFSQSELIPTWWPPEPCDQIDPCNFLQNGSPLDDPSTYLSSINTNPINNICTQDLDGANVVPCWFAIAGLPGIPMNPRQAPLVLEQQFHLKC